MRLFLLALALLILPDPLGADAIIRTRAMLASTIAEYFIEEDSVTVELEIGGADLDGFRNLLPDEIHERLGHTPQPLRERFRRFWAEDFVVQSGAGETQPARLQEMGLRTRVRRDEISGEPLPESDKEKETVLFVRMQFPLPGKPPTVTIGGSVTRQASIGFVAYHREIAVNDFRYLAPSQTLELNWEDPWYSQFDISALRRAYFAPMSGFLYVETYEVRKEIVLRPKDLQYWIDLGLAGRATIPVDMQDELKRTVAAFLSEHQVVKIDGQSTTPELAQINFLERTLKSSRVVDPPIEMDLNGAILGVIFVYPTEGLPNRVTMEWDLFNERIQKVPAAAVDQAGPLPTYLTPDFDLLEWQNFLKNPQLPTLTVLSRPPGRLVRSMAALRWIALGLGALVAFWSLRRRRGSAVVRAIVVSLALGLAVASFWVGREAQLSDERTREVVAGLLHNVYRAFDFRDEERIYDVLDGSIQGDLLTQVYLETRRGLELANQGGARAKVKEVDLVDLEAESGEGGSFGATATWTVAGSVGHWGHVHQRQNQYQATLTVEPVNGVWKLTRLEILEEVRL